MASSTRGCSTTSFSPTCVIFSYNWLVCQTLQFSRCLEMWWILYIYSLLFGTFFFALFSFLKEFLWLDEVMKSGQSRLLVRFPNRTIPYKYGHQYSHSLLSLIPCCLPWLNVWRSRCSPRVLPARNYFLSSARLWWDTLRQSVRQNGLPQCQDSQYDGIL